MILFKNYLAGLILLLFCINTSAEGVAKENGILEEILLHENIFIVRNQKVDNENSLSVERIIKGHVSKEINERLKIAQKLPIRKNQVFLCLFWKNKTSEFRLMKIEKNDLVCVANQGKRDCVAIKQIEGALTGEGKN